MLDLHLIGWLICTAGSSALNGVSKLCCQPSWFGFFFFLSFSFRSSFFSFHFSFFIFFQFFHFFNSSFSIFFHLFICYIFSFFWCCHFSIFHFFHFSCLVFTFFLFLDFSLFFKILTISSDDRQFYTTKPPRSGTTTCTTTPADALTYVRAGALVPSPPCLGGGATRVGPGQHRQYTRPDIGQEPVRGSPHRDHRAPQVSQAVSPRQSTRLTSRAW